MREELTRRPDLNCQRREIAVGPRNNIYFKCKTVEEKCLLPVE